MEKVTFGKTGLKVSRLGFGGAELGSRAGVGKAEAREILEAVLDAGINLLDTAACYSDSEEKIGQAVADRRDEYVLVSKCGHSVDGVTAAAWSPEVVAQSAERSLRRLRTDHLDVLLLHSCDEKHLKNDKLIDALVEAKRSGKTRFVGYSGDASAAELAMTIDAFDCFETSVNFCDQQGLDRYLPQARQRNLGVLAKRPIANAAWRDTSEFDAFYKSYAKPYVDRLAEMGFTPESVGFDGSWIELALRFSVFQPGVHTAIVGTTNIEHIRSNAHVIEQGPLPDAVVDSLRKIWRKHDDGSWTGQT